MSGRPRAAILVIHGIGQQAPLATLGRLAQGWMTDAWARGLPVRVEPAVVASADRLQPVLRLHPLAADEVAGFARIDLYEFAWQRLVAGRAGPWGVLQWLLQTGLAPLHVRRSWRLLAIAGTSPWNLVLRHAAIASGLLLLLLTLLLALAIGLLQLPPWLPLLHRAVAGVAAGWSWWAGLGVALTLIAALLAASMAWALLVDSYEEAALRRARLPDGWAGGFAGARRSWLPAALLGIALAAALALAAGVANRDAWTALAAALAPLALPPGLPTAAGALLALLWSWRWLQSHLGDIALYVKGPADSPFGRTRARLQGALVAQLRALLSADPDAGYDVVVLVGHSLGSVLALDALDILAMEGIAHGAAGPNPDLQRLRGLFTFGSPLDKVAYLFRERIADDEAVHAQLAAFWRGTRRRPEPRDPGPYALAPRPEGLSRLRWWHLHAPLDPISDPLWLYRVDARHTLTGGPWWGAHGHYWRDPRVFALLRELLEGLAPSTAAHPR